MAIHQGIRLTYAEFAREVERLALALLALAGCAALDEKQREWIFQPSHRTWAGAALSAAGPPRLG